jgi:hypothetical protein
MPSSLGDLLFCKSDRIDRKKTMTTSPSSIVSSSASAQNSMLPQMKGFNYRLSGEQLLYFSDMHIEADRKKQFVEHGQTQLSLNYCVQTKPFTQCLANAMCNDQVEVVLEVERAFVRHVFSCKTGINGEKAQIALSPIVIQANGGCEDCRTSCSTGGNNGTQKYNGITLHPDGSGTMKSTGWLTLHPVAPSFFCVKCWDPVGNEEVYLQDFLVVFRARLRNPWIGKLH